MIKTEATMAIIAIAALVGGVWIVTRRRTDGGSIVQDAAASAAGTVIQAAGDVGTGIVIGAGQAVGIPKTDMTECQRAIAEGRTWDASFACPAGTFLSSLWN